MGPSPAFFTSRIDVLGRGGPRREHCRDPDELEFAQRWRRPQTRSRRHPVETGPDTQRSSPAIRHGRSTRRLRSWSSPTPARPRRTRCAHRLGDRRRADRTEVHYRTGTTPEGLRERRAASRFLLGSSLRWSDRRDRRARDCATKLLSYPARSALREEIARRSGRHLALPAGLQAPGAFNAVMHVIQADRASSRQPSARPRAHARRSRRLALAIRLVSG